jgi:hypothetical protein
VEASAVTGLHLVDRGRALVRVAREQRGRTYLHFPGDDDLADPYGGPFSGFVSCAALVHRALQRPLDLLAGGHVDPRP